MKKIISTFLLVFSIAVTLAQTNEGIVSYEEKRKLQLIPDSSQAERMRVRLPKEDVSRTILLFTPEASYYKHSEEARGENSIDEENNGQRVVIKMDKPDNKFYRDLVNGKFIQYREFLTRKFLVNSDIGKPDWKLTGNQKTILGYTCMEAKREDNAQTILAWFAPSIPVPVGPSVYGNLPGLILSVNVNDGDLIINATNVRLAPVDKKLMIKPTDGKKVTEQEFKRIVDEKTAEMREQNGGSGNVIIRIQDDNH
jgi:GLPGLI family protein